MDDFFDEPNTVPVLHNIDDYCKNITGSPMACFNDVEQIVSKYGNIVDIAPNTGMLDGTTHVILTSRAIAEERSSANCHNMASRYVCHVETARLYEVVTQIQDGTSRTLRVQCHSGETPGCHLLF